MNWSPLGFVILLLCIVQPAFAGSLENRLNQFPQWHKPFVEAAAGDLVYPDWMERTWTVTSTLVEAIAPLAPEIVTPGFAGNQSYLNQPVTFPVRFVESPSWRKWLPSLARSSVVSDRAFNGLNIAKAYLGEDQVLAVKVDPQNPNRQLTFLPGQRQLISTVTGRRSESPAPNQFIATEVCQQVFRGNQIYLNEVETTTAYQLTQTGIKANQVTAIYLSPQDPHYFQANSRPVALYRYWLELLPGGETLR